MARRDLIRKINLDDGDEEDAVQLTLDGTNSARQSRWSERVLQNGEPQPLFYIANREDRRFACPRLEFVESIKPPSPYDLALSWGIPRVKIQEWKREQDWERQRQTHWEEINRCTWEQAPQDLIELRGKALQRALVGFRNLGETVLHMARRGEVSYITKDGQVGWKPLGPSDIQRLSKAFEINARGELLCLGLNLSLQEQAQDNPDSQANKPVLQMIFNMPATEAEKARLLQPKAIMGPDSIEGEIVSSIPPETPETVPRRRYGLAPPIPDTDPAYTDPNYDVFDLDPAELDLSDE